MPKPENNGSRTEAQTNRNLVIEYLPTAALHPQSHNSRLHSEKQVRQIANSIQAFGFNVPILIDSSRRAIAGHGRLRACELLGISEVPTIRLEHLTDNQARAFMIADNRLTENAEWDAQLLGQQLKILSEAAIDFSLETTGFEMGEIDMFIEGSATEMGVEPSTVEHEVELPENAVSRPGDLWKLGKNRLLCGNALARTSYEMLMGEKKAGMIFADPPYNVPIGGHVSGNGKHTHREFAMGVGEMDRAEFTKFLTDVLYLTAAFAAEGSLHYVCMDWRHLGELLAAGAVAYSDLKNVCVWVKDNPGLGSFYRSQHEFICVFQKGQDFYRNNIQLGRFGRSRSNVWNYPSVNSFGRTTSEGNLLSLHPTVKPVELVADAIRDCSARGGLVLDPFVGSGTTMIAAERTGRVCYGVEIDPLYVDTAIRRWQRFTHLAAIHEATGKTFEEREQEVTHDDGRNTD